MGTLDFKEFTMLAILQDQTEKVHFIVQHENRIDPEECFYNKYDISINLSSGKETMPSQQYHNKVNRLGSMYRSLSTRMQELDDQNEDTSAIEIEMESIHSLLLEYEEGEYKERKIYQWRLVPHWISEELIKKGETVFRLIVIAGGE